MTDADFAWLEYQVIMGSRLDLENCSQVERDLFKAIFQDGYQIGRNEIKHREGEE